MFVMVVMAMLFVRSSSLRLRGRDRRAWSLYHVNYWREFTRLTGTNDYANARTLSQLAFTYVGGVQELIQHMLRCIMS